MISQIFAAPMIGVGSVDWFRYPLPPNRTCGSPDPALQSVVLPARGLTVQRMGVSCKLRGSRVGAPSTSVLSGPAVRPALISVRALSGTSSPMGNVVGVFPLGSDFTSPPSCTPSLPRHYPASSLL